MRSQSYIVLAAAIFLGLIAAVIANFLIDRPQAPQQAETPAGQTRVVVAKLPLTFGAAVGSEQLKEVAWPADAVPPGAFRSVAEVTQGGNRIALRAIEMNEPVLASKVSGKGGRLSMSGLIGKDMRAATIRVNDVAGVAGFLLPGDRVDVLLTRTPDGEGAQPFTDILLQNVRVVAVGQDANEAKDKPELVQTVTVEVSQAQAQKLALAQTVGTMNLALRNLSNLAPERPATVRVADLRDGLTARPVTVRGPARVVYRSAPVRRAPSGSTVEVVRGVASSSYQVPIGA